MAIPGLRMMMNLIYVTPDKEHCILPTQIATHELLCPLFLLSLTTKMPRNVTLSTKTASAMVGIRKIILVPTCHPLFFTLFSFKMYLSFLQRCSAFFFLFILLRLCCVQYLMRKDLVNPLKQVKTRALKEHVLTSNYYCYCLP